MDSVPPNVLDAISDRSVSPLIDRRPSRRYRVTFGMHGYMFICPLYTGRKIDSGTCMSGVALGKLALNSDNDSDCLYD
jgi:hypothetical protein